MGATEVMQVEEGLHEGVGNKGERMYSIWRRDQHFLTDKVSGTRKTEHMDLEILGMRY